ncbi:MAG: putative oxidoreductase C-terminal domain-containing protein [Betaproteobacteria bacterium]
MKLTILDPGHFHAALLQKSMVADIDPTVHVYADEGPELRDYVSRVESFNHRPDDPTRWQLVIHASPDFLERFIADRASGAAGEIVVIAGNNRRKTEYLTRAIAAGFHVLADKPMAIDADGFRLLEQAFANAGSNGLLLYDIMTERHEITTLLQKAFAALPPVFGELATGSEEDPAVTKESVHHFAKQVSGSPLKRPAWFFDTAQQGEGIVDVTTHLVDLVQWACFPDQAIDYRNDIRIVGARRWPTAISQAQFDEVTGLQRFPDFLRKDVGADGKLHVHANGEIRYRIRGVHAKVSVHWNFAAPAGGDTHFSILRGTRANLVIRQGEAQSWQPVLAIEPRDSANTAGLESALQRALPAVQQAYPGIDLKRAGAGWDVVVPASFHVGHEAHFGQVADEFLRYVKRGSLPAWEVSNLLAKYYTTTSALALALARPA